MSTERRLFTPREPAVDADHDHQVSDELRFVQLTPPGSACSIAFGEGIVDMPPGSVQGLQLVVSDIKAARTELVGRGMDVSEIQEFPWGSFCLLQRPRWQPLGRPTVACPPVVPPVTRTDELIDPGLASSSGDRTEQLLEVVPPDGPIVVPVGGSASK